MTPQNSDIRMTLEHKILNHAIIYCKIDSLNKYLHVVSFAINQKVITHTLNNSFF